MQILAVCSVIGLISQQANGSTISLIICVSLVPLTKNLLRAIPVLLATPCLENLMIMSCTLQKNFYRIFSLSSLSGTFSRAEMPVPQEGGENFCATSFIGKIARDARTTRGRRNF